MTRTLFLLLILSFSVQLFAQKVADDSLLPFTSDSVVIHVVAPRENLYRISLKYSITVEQIKEWNNITGDAIEVGQNIIVWKKNQGEVFQKKNKTSDTILVESVPPVTIEQKYPSDTVSDLIYSGKDHPVVEKDLTKKPDAVPTVPRVYTATQLTGTVTIDGIIDEESWKNASLADHFIQRDPVEGADVSQQTEVRLMYTNSAIYIAAIMHDTHPDSILHQLGNRDESDGLNADAFRFGLDPYNTRQSGYVFEVSAAGVQSESFNSDLTFDAVWESAVTCTKDGWSAEMKIPYSAIRFPASEEQTWAIQFARLIRRNREYDQWTLTPKNVQNAMLYWGTLKGIKNINPPLRLSLTPYISFYTEKSPFTDENGNTGYQNSYTYSGGADIKYGINESFTVDLTLLPDFSQVQSDNKVKNLSAYETFYDEQRPFFKEGTELFSKGDLLYTRRIGKTPTGFYSVEDDLQSGEKISENPDKAKLLNAAKISGRTEKGLGIGLLNAVTANTYAVIKNEDGSVRKLKTEPLSNYNLFIFDQQLKNNSYVTLVNTNVAREGNYRDANVTLFQGRYENPGHQFQVSGVYSESHIFEWQNDENGASSKKDTRGQNTSLGVDKISGVSWYGARYATFDKFYDKNDMGYMNTNDYSQAHAYYSYNKFNPFWKYFKQGSLTFFANRSGRLSDNNILKDFNGGMNFFLLFNTNWSLYTEFGGTPVKGRDYDEPRIENNYWATPVNYYGSINFTTNYNKALAFDFGSSLNAAPDINYRGVGYYLVPMIRFSDKFNIKLSTNLNLNHNDLGFAYLNEAADTSYFGRRDIVNVTNAFSSRYIFKNDMSVTLTARHYWSKGNYDQFYRLETNGTMTPINVAPEHISDYDFNSNYLTVDIVYNWQFAPGSSFLVTYKNLILSDTQENVKGYFTNLSNTFSYPQTNSISLKVLYYLDYQYLVKKKS